GTEILEEEEYAQFTWEEIPNADVYRYVIIDKLCLMEKMNLEECLVLTGESVWPDMVFNEGDNRPVKPLVKGRTYVISIYALSEEGEVLNDGSYEFLYK
ncbi:MAG: hypothetical protein KJN76_11010, partial [Eudoraea sp.]|nr:hypothetical protein [Eudoraea sp.]